MDELASAGQDRKGSRTSAIADELLKELAIGKFSVGDRYPPERELQTRFGVGRHTIREALKMLTEQGLLGRRRKMGTFVLSVTPLSPYVHSLRDLRGLLDFATTTNLVIKHLGTVSMSDRFKSEFRDLPSGRWLRVAGMRWLQGSAVPLCWSEVLVPEQFAPPREFLSESSVAIYEETMRHNNLRLEYVEQEVTATQLPPRIIDLLQTDGHEAALLVKRRYVAHTGETFEVSHNLYPASRYTIRNVIRQRA